MNGKKITFKGVLDNFKTKDNGVTIQLKATTDNISLDKLNAISDGDITVCLESSQLELIENLDGEFDESDVAFLEVKVTINNSNGTREKHYTVTTNDGSIYEISEDLYEILKLQMLGEPTGKSNGKAVKGKDNVAKSNAGGMNLFDINPNSKKVQQMLA